MSKPEPARYRTTNWFADNVALRKRGSLLIWLDKEMGWHAPHEGRLGRAPIFSNGAIQFCLSIKVLSKLPFRQTAGMVASLLQLAGLDWPVPDYSTLCRRQKALLAQIPYRRADGPLNLLADSAGIKLLGDGEWPARKHGVHGRRQWRKVHLAMDTATSDIRAVEFTSSREGDSPVSPVLPDLMHQIRDDEDISTVTADGAYDTRRCHSAIIARGGTAIIAIRKNGRPWKEGCPAARARNETLRATRHYGRAFWKRWTGYHARSRDEAKMPALKSFGERIAQRETQTAKPPKSTFAPHSSAASMISASLRSSACLEPEEKKGPHASGHLSATMQDRSLTRALTSRFVDEFRQGAAAAHRPPLYPCRLHAGRRTRGMHERPFVAVGSPD